MTSRVAPSHVALTALLALAPLACSSTTAVRSARPAPEASAPEVAPEMRAAPVLAAARAEVAPQAQADEGAEAEELIQDFADDEALEEEERRSYVREGFFASRDQALAKGVHVIGVQQADVDLDGRMDEVLALLPADGSSARQGCVLAQRTARGWTAALLTSNIGSLNTSLECGAPVRAGDTVFLRTTMISDGSREFGPDAHRVEQLYMAEAAGGVRVVGYVEAAWPAGGPLRVEAAGPDALVVVARGPRYARVSWDAARGTASVSEWSDRAR